MNMERYTLPAPPINIILEEEEEEENIAIAMGAPLIPSFKSMLQHQQHLPSYLYNQYHVNCFFLLWSIVSFINSKSPINS